MILDLPSNMRNEERLASALPKRGRHVLIHSLIIVSNGILLEIPDTTASSPSPKLGQDYDRSLDGDLEVSFPDSRYPSLETQMLGSKVTNRWHCLCISKPVPPHT